MGLKLGDIVNCTYRGTYEGQEIRYVLHYRCTTNGTGATPESDLYAVSGFMVDPVQFPLFGALLDCHASDFHFKGCATSVVAPVKTTVMMGAVDLLGEIMDPCFPPNVAMVITKRTLQQGRRGRGSIHLSGCPISSVLNGEITPAGTTLYQAVANAMITAFTVPQISLTLEPGLYHPTLITAPFSRLFDARVETTSRTMRRRTVRVGI